MCHDHSLRAAGSRPPPDDVLVATLTSWTRRETAVTESPANTEGVIRFELEHGASREFDARDMPCLKELDGWRWVLRHLGLLGRDANRYGGYGFGNLSHRVPAESGTEPAFVISGSQTGEREFLGNQGWALVRDWDLGEFRAVASGPVPPSSESLTHAVIYEIAEHVQCVVHVHSPEIWQATGELNLPCTGPDIDYGTVEMVQQVRGLFQAGLAEVGVFTMTGHEDGVVAFGTDAADACGRLLTVLSRSVGGSVTLRALHGRQDRSHNEQRQPER
ncbi:MAG: class II aldolase/adducin family protein [Thermoanaerobaculia bacterium]|nr:class II aldolase/adducin family protein [Thermoanaerobaculia bacterium]